MHIASLAHDDIVDDSPSRRGQQTQHLKYGSMIAIFNGNYIISKAYIYILYCIEVKQLHNIIVQGCIKYMRILWQV